MNKNQYGVGSPCRTICTVCGSPPCPDLNLIHYILGRAPRANVVFMLRFFSAANRGLLGA
ncbi:hypothetical protein ELB75_02525 [Eikenella corrodens]|uniref:Uncharacterized protein n=1 Tax=Eikenella corrodens TaxID=539 RepID=A0A3S9SMS5_EIKCO|nr:hypothetical protein ELB75_02525 [Eikenella corrodens]